MGAKREAGGIDEEQDHHQEHARHGRMETLHQAERRSFPALQAFIRQVEKHEHHSDESQQIDQESVVPLDVGKKACQEG